MKSLIGIQARPAKMRDIEFLGGGVGLIDCLDCDGTGIFIMPDDIEETCVACKGTGKRFCAAWEEG